MDDCADLEVKLHVNAPNTYAIEMRSAVPDSETVAFLGLREGCTATIDPVALATAPDTDAYGRALTAALFDHERVRVTFAKAKEEARSIGMPLRLRLVMEAPELHDVRWETLFDPSDDTSRLALSGQMRLSRYPISQDRERVVLRRRSELRALVAIANRRDIGPVNVRAEAQRATRALGAIQSDVLPDERDGVASRATLITIRERLQQGGHDILYVVAHGGIRDGSARIWLDEEPGDQHDSVGADRFAAMIRELDVRPRLIVLGSCESAGTGVGGAATAIGPQLAAAGVPAVLAMQGNITVATLDRFMTVFFEHLARDGLIDRAVSEARNAVWNQDDWWAPALFMRLASGRIWSLGFAGGQSVQDDWRDLRDNIRIKECTPILGPGLMESILGPRRELARALADEYQYPLGSADVDHLYRVDQYITTRFRPNQVRHARRRAMRDRLLERHAAAIPEPIRSEPHWNDDQLREAVGAVIDASLESRPDGPYRRLARLKLPIYVETSTHDAMERAIRLEGATPHVRTCPWYVNRPVPELHLYSDKPTPDDPLVYHLFGRAAIAESVAVGDDGVFDYLLGLGRNLEHVPNDVRAALVGGTSLMMLGFRLDDPEFRTAFRYIMTREGADMLEDRSHAAVQIEPSDDLVTDVGLAHDYYERYFTRRDMTPYWGNSDEFMSEVWEWMQDPT